MNQNISAIFFDLGDTIMDEDTEVKDTTGTTQSADLFDGMADALHKLHQQGFRLALVADSRPNTPLNVLNQHGLLDLFDWLSISETVGASKPDEHIFLHALNGLGIPEAEYPHVLMVGNNLERDIAGANALGLRPVFFHANDHRGIIPQNRAEHPRHTVTNAQELLDLVELLSIPVDGSQPPQSALPAADRALVSRFSPIIRFDEAEPFLPITAGCTVFHREDPSPSFYRRIQRDWRPAWETAIEYAIWWDWDIGHLYEEEHIWTYLDGAGDLVWVEGSSHGGYASMLLEGGEIPREGDHPLVYSQPGKHAFSPTPHWFQIFRDNVTAETLDRAGYDGVLVKDIYKRQISKTAQNDAAAAAWLRQQAFTPTLRFNQEFRFAPDQFIPWPVLDTWIPARVNWILRQLQAD